MREEKHIKENMSTVAISRENLLPGDIVIVTDTRPNTHAFNSLTRLVQSTQFFFNKGHSAAVHAMIVGRDDSGELKFIEVSDSGVLLTDIKDRYKYNMFVYRSTHRVLAERAGKVAYEGYKEYCQVKDKTNLKEVPTTEEKFQEVSKKAEDVAGKKEITYSDGGLVHAIVFPKLLFPYHFTSSTFSLRTFCSKFVIQSYQIAQNELVKESPRLKKEIQEIFKKEKTSSVKSLEDYVSNHKHFVQHIIPKEQETIYPALVTLILLNEINAQKKNKKYSEGANKASELYEILTHHIKENNILDSKNHTKNFDLAIAVYRLVLAQLPYHEEVKKKGYEFGFEPHMLSDPRIMDLADKLKSEVKDKGKVQWATYNLELDEPDKDNKDDPYADFDFKL